MRKSTGDLHFDERMNESRGPGEVHHAVVAGAARELGGILPRGAFDEHPLDRADHALADRARLRLQLRLEALQPLLPDPTPRDVKLQRLQLHVTRGWVGQLRRGRPGPRAVEEGKGGIEADVAG